jgi:hypothetical protein
MYLIYNTDRLLMFYLVLFYLKIIDILVRKLSLQTTSDIVHLMFISIRNCQIVNLGQRHLTEPQIPDQREKDL